jgi:hypothetical protein
VHLARVPLRAGGWSPGRLERTIDGVVDRGHTVDRSRTMAQGALVIGWGAPARGREQASLQVFGEAFEYYDDLVKNHRLTSHQPFISTNRNGGMWILSGEMAQLDEIRNEDEYLRLVTRAQLIVDDFTVDICIGGSGEALNGIMTMFGEEAQTFE